MTNDKKHNQFDLKKHLSKPAFYYLYQNQQIDNKRFFQDINTICQALDTKTNIINQCNNRYLFACLMFASLVLDKIILLPNFKNNSFIQELKEKYKNCVVLRDEDILIMLQNSSKGTNNINFLFDIHKKHFYFWTSGTSGKPKIIAHSFDFLYNRAISATCALKLEDKNKTILSTMVPQHMYGMEVCIFWPFVSSLICVAQRFIYFDDIQKQCQTEKDYILATTPFNLKIYLANSSLPANIQQVISATETLDKSFIKKIKQNKKCKITQIYGSTETASVAFCDDASSNIYNLYQYLQLVQKENQLYVVDNNNNNSYLIQDNLQSLDNRRFIFKYRPNDLLKIAGNRISAKFLANKLMLNSQIKDALFWQNKDKQLCLLVVSNITSAQIKQYLHKQVDLIFIPKQIYHTYKIPRDNNGKTQKEEIAKLLIK
jgi:acyl-coenzyme A synthetase/AMP-(fatty) acid ligase